MPFYPLKSLLLGTLSVNSFLSMTECQQIVETSERTMKLAAGKTEDPRTGLRQLDIAWLDSDGDRRWLFDKVKDCISEINRNYFRFDLAGFEGRH